MVTFRRFLVCLTVALATWGMSHATPARESGENEAAERNGSSNEGSESEGAEQDGSKNEGVERNEPTSSGAGSSTSSGNSSNETSSSNSTGTSSSGSASNNTVSANDDTLGTESSRAKSTSAKSATSNSTRSVSTTRATSSRTPTASSTTRSRDGGTERKAKLRTIVGGRGSAEYEVSGTNRSFEVELENTTLTPGQTLSVCVNDVSVGAMTVGLSGRRAKARLKLETRLGQAVPTISAGSVVTIKLGTATVASGTF